MPPKFKLPSFTAIENAEKSRKQNTSPIKSVHHIVDTPSTNTSSGAPSPIPLQCAPALAQSSIPTSTTLAKPTGSNFIDSTQRTRTIIVSNRQKGNPILKHILAVPYEFSSDILPDFLVGRTSFALYLSIRYHRLNPDYIYDRMKSIGVHMFNLRILILHIDVGDPQQAIREMTKLCILQQYTLMLAWSTEEVARILETYKSYETKSADSIKERIENDYLSQAIDCLTTIKGVNKTDVMTLLAVFGSIKGIAQATADQLIQCPGIGPSKVNRILEAFDQPFLTSFSAMKD